MARASERERQDLAELVATRIAELGVTEVARVTGLSTTALREYANDGIKPGVRASTLGSLRRLKAEGEQVADENGAGAGGENDRVGAVESRVSAVEGRLSRIEDQLAQMIQLLRDLDRRIQGTSPGDSAEA